MGSMKSSSNALSLHLRRLRVTGDFKGTATGASSPAELALRMPLSTASSSAELHFLFCHVCENERTKSVWSNILSLDGNILCLEFCFGTIPSLVSLVPDNSLHQLREAAVHHHPWNQNKASSVNSHSSVSVSMEHWPHGSAFIVNGLVGVSFPWGALARPAAENPQLRRIKRVDQRQTVVFPHLVEKLEVHGHQQKPTCSRQRCRERRWPSRDKNTRHAYGNSWKQFLPNVNVFKSLTKIVLEIWCCVIIADVWTQVGKSVRTERWFLHQFWKHVCG